MKTNVTKIRSKTRVQALSEPALLILNLKQVLQEFIKEYGAYTALEVLPGMVQELQRKVQLENKAARRAK
jgi:hypothetical protein